MASSVGKPSRVTGAISHFKVVKIFGLSKTTNLYEISVNSVWLQLCLQSSDRKLTLMSVALESYVSSSSGRM